MPRGPGDSISEPLAFKSFKALGVGDAARGVGCRNRGNPHDQGFKALGVGDAARGWLKNQSDRDVDQGFKALGVGDAAHGASDPANPRSGRKPGFKALGVGDAAHGSIASVMSVTKMLSFKAVGVGDAARGFGEW